MEGIKISFEEAVQRIKEGKEVLAMNKLKEPLYGIKEHLVPVDKYLVDTLENFISAEYYIIAEKKESLSDDRKR